MNKKAYAVKVPSIPVVVKKGSTIKLLNNSLPKNDLLMRCIKFSTVAQDQIIYKSVPGDFLRGEFPGLTLVNRINVLNQSSSTVAKFFTDGKSGGTIEKNSHELVKVIGQNNYDTVFSALCSVISQELRIRALLALLTIEGSKTKKEVSAQTEKSFADCACQTDESSWNILENFKQRRRVRRQQFRAYIVKGEENKVKRVVINPKSLLRNSLHTTLDNTCNKDNKVLSNSSNTNNCIPKANINEKENAAFPELSGIVNEDSNFSDISIGNISLTSQHSVNIPQLLDNPNSLLNNVDHHTESLNIVPLNLLDGSVIMVCAKPIDKFHWATPEILKNLSHADQSKLMYQQAFIHWKYCMEEDDDGYLPIHQAVLSNDIDFLNRQCAALKKKYGSVDIPAAGNLTALQMSIYKGGERCTALLLQHGADPCLQDDEGKNLFHKAAEVSREHLEIALDHCRNHARVLLKEDEDLWNPIMEDQPDERLANILLDHICIMCDNQGYTPLMLASRQGHHASVKLLLNASPDTVNRPTPNGGSSALYLAVEAACLESTNSKNQTKISENFLKTIDILMEGGGDPSLENHSGSSVNTLLTEFNIVDLSVLIANKLTSVKYFDGNTFAAGNTFAVGNISSLMLFKNSDGKVDVTEIRSRRGPDESREGNDDGTGGAAPGGSDPGTKLDGASENVDVNRDRKGGRPVADSASERSNVKIKDIKAININMEEGGGAVRGARGAGSAAGGVKPSHFIIVPKRPTPRPQVPKYVKILPKLEKGGGSGGDERNVNSAGTLIEKMHEIRKRKLNVECKLPTFKISRQETKQSHKKK